MANFKSYLLILLICHAKFASLRDVKFSFKISRIVLKKRDNKPKENQ